MDLVPVDYLPTLAKVSEVTGMVENSKDAYFKVVPTTDPYNLDTIYSFVWIIFYSIKIKGLKGF